MQKIKQILTFFNSRELRKLKEYVESEFFNIENSVRMYLKHLLEIDDLKNSSVSKEEIWKVISDKPFEDLKYRVLISKTYEELIRFMGIEALLKEEALIIGKGMEQSLKNEVVILANSASKKLKSRLHKHFYRDGDWILLNYQTSLLRLQSLNLDVKRNKAKDEQLQLLGEINEHLDGFYYNEKLRLLTTYLTWKGLVSTIELPSWGEEIISKIDDMDKINYGSVITYFNAVKLITSPDDLNIYYEFKKELSHTLHQFKEREQKDLLDLSLNYCLRKVNQGDTNFLLEIFQTFKMMIDQGVLTTNNKLNPWKYKNITGVALRLKEFKWIRSFIDEFGPKLPPDFRESGMALSRAQLAFYLGEFEHVLSFLQNVQFKEFGYNTTVKSLQLAAYYELDEYELLEDMSISFKKYLKRQHRLSLNRKDHFYNLISFVRQLSKMNPRKTNELLKLRNEIQTTKGLASKTWLLEKVDELIGEPKK